MEQEMINIKLTFTGVIDIKNATNNSIIQVEKNSSVGDVLTRLGIRREHKKYIISIVNDEKQKQTYILQDKDHLSLFLPVGGG